MVAVSVARTADHHSAGSLSRCHHLETAVAGAPVSAAMASREGHSSMMERNEVNSVMAKLLGQPVPKIKAIVSDDCGKGIGHNVLMEDEDDKLAESLWREQFRLRLIAARGNRSQLVMAELLDVKPNTYSKYEAPSRASMMSVRKLPLFAKICGVELEELITGKPRPKAVQSQPKPKTKQKSRKTS
jgi:hypothetical protein